LNFGHSIFGFVSANFIKSGDIRVSKLNVLPEWQSTAAYLNLEKKMSENFEPIIIAFCCNF